jgi:hypothetical protein
MDSSYQAQAVVGAGRSALIGAMFGSGWLGWGLGVTKAFEIGFVGPALGLLTIFLCACSIYTIVNGRRLRRKFPPLPASARRAVIRPFIVVLIAECVAIGLVVVIAYLREREDIAAAGCALVVGLHFLPLAKIFRAPRLAVFGILIALWCVLCLIFYRSQALVISVSIGTGILLWASSITTLLRARKIAHYLKRVESSQV